MEQQTPDTVESPAITTPLGIACKNCGTDLKTLHVEGNCPTCERPIRESLHGYSDTWQLLDDRPCLKCGYNLLGQTLGSVCPECGIPIEKSFIGNLLGYGDLRYLRNVRRGTRYVLWPIALVIILSVLFVATTATIEIIQQNSERVLYAAGIVWIVGLIGLYLLGLVGIWKYSMEPTSKLTLETGSRTRRRIRLLLILYVALICLSFISDYFIPDDASTIGVILVGLFSAGAFLAYYFIAMDMIRYAKILAIRLSEAKLYHLTSKTLNRFIIVGYIYLATALLGAFFFLGIEFFAAWSDGEPILFTISQFAFLGSYIIAITGSLIVFIYFIRTLSMLNKSLRSQIRQLQTASPATPDPPRAHRHPGTRSGAEGPMP